MTKPTVLIIGPTPPPYNGMSVATGLVLEAFGGNISVIYLDTADHRDISNVGKIDFTNVLLAFQHGFKYLWLLMTERPEIVYVPIAQDSLPFLRDCLFLIPARLFRRKVVIHLHGGYFGTFFLNASSFMQRIIRYALGKADRAIVLGEVLGNAFNGVLPRDRVRVIPNGIPDLFKDHKRETRNGRRPTVLFLSTLMREKGTLDVLKALPAVAARVPDVQAIFAGEWFRAEDKELAQKLIHDLGLESCVKFIGPVAPSQKCEVLKSADLFVLPTCYKYEGHPYVILEAMSAGLPVISTAVGCIPETVLDGKSGFVLDPQSKETLAEKIALLLSVEHLRKGMGEASRMRFLELYTLDRFTAQMENVFKELSSQ